MRVPHLFYTGDPERQTLHRRITPTPEQRTQQQVRWQDVRDFLVNDLFETSGYRMSSWLQGSYKFGTQIRPSKKGDEFDIDLGIYFNWAGDAHTTGERPRDLKQQVQHSLEAYAREAEDDVLEVVTPPKERCSRVRFTGDFHVDVPTYHLDPDRDARDLATETNGWEVSDPKALYVWFQQLFADDDTAQARRLIRYVKMWAALKLQERPSSVVLTVLVAEAVVALRPDFLISDDVAVLNVTLALRERLARDRRVENPVHPQEDLNRLSEEGHRDFVAKLGDLSRIARDALDAADEVTTAAIWSEAFDAFFPAGTPAQPVAGALAPLRFVPEVGIEVRSPGSQVTLRGENGINAVPKKSAITFRLLNAHLFPPGARVRWIVRNEGTEAEMANDLGHVSDAGDTVTRDAEYRGTHHMDVVVTDHLGALLGFRRVPVHITGLAMPPRNPRRPGYTRYGRR